MNIHGGFLLVMGARVMYSVKAPAGDEYRMCLKELETTCADGVCMHVQMVSAISHCRSSLT